MQIQKQDELNQEICSNAYLLAIEQPQRRLTSGPLQIILTNIGDCDLLDLYAAGHGKVAAFRIYRDGSADTITVDVKSFATWLPELIRLVAPRIAAAVQSLH